MKKYLYLTAALAATVSLTSCSDSDKDDDPKYDKEYLNHDVTYVLTQGNFYNNIEGGLNVIDNKTFDVQKNIFKNVNGVSLGDTPQCGVAYGSKIYIGTSKSNTIEIIDCATLRSVKQLKLSENPANGTSPYSMIAHSGYVYISMYDGYLARLDTLDLKIDKSVAVGQNPDQIALHKGKIYVPISEGMNWPNYGTTAVVVDPKSMQIEEKFTVGLNPSQFISADGELFLLCKGNYESDPAKLIASKLYRINSDLTSTEICEATLVGALDDDLLIVNEPFIQGAPVATYYEYDVDSKKLERIDIPNIDYANQIYFDDRTERLFISSYIMDGIYPSYDLPGYVCVYDDDLRFIKKCELGSGGPACIFSWRK